MSSLSSMFLGGRGGDLGAAAVLDGQNVTEVQWETEIKKCFVIQPTRCTIMASLSSMFLGSLGGLEAAGCFGWTKCDRSSMRNRNKKSALSFNTFIVQ